MIYGIHEAWSSCIRVYTRDKKGFESNLTIYFHAEKKSMQETLLRERDVYIRQLFGDRDHVCRLVGANVMKEKSSISDTGLVVRSANRKTLENLSASR